MRIGHGYDVHRLVEGRRLILGGVEIPYEKADGFYSSFDGIQSTKTDGWLLYINDAMAEKGAEEQPIADGDVITWKYVNYAEAFPVE